MDTKYVQRKIFSKIFKHLKKKEITIIIGPRQVGKTVMLKELQNALIVKNKVKIDSIFYFNLDIVSDRALFEDQSEFINFIKQRSQKQKIYLFIDEAQKVKNPGTFFKGVYDSDLNAKLILTGSSTLEIRSKIHESLTGRKRMFHLLPFVFSEILDYKKPQLAQLIRNKKVNKYDQQNILKIFEDYCIWGGYPQVVLAKEVSEKQEYLKEIFSSYIEKDVIGFLRIENENNVIKLVKLLAGQIGNLINTSELSTLVATDRYTIDRYLNILTKTFITYSLLPFYINPRQEIIKANKIYFIDNGLRNLGLEKLSQPFSKREDKGNLLENIVLKELLALKYENNFKIRFWRSKQKAEVDFIVEKGLDIIPVEVKSNLMNSKLEQSLIGFIERYNPKKAFVINLGYTGIRKIKNTKVFFIYPYEIEKYIK